jgi:hypothetical protein
LCTDQGESRLGWATTRARTWAERTGTRVRPWSARRRSPNTRALALTFGQVRRAPLPSAVLARAYKASPGVPHFTPRSPSPASHPSLAPASSFPPATASATMASPLQPPQVEPVLRLAPPVAREAFQALGPGRTSPEARDRLHRTSVARLRAWTKLSGEPFLNSLCTPLPCSLVKLSDPFD